MNIPGTHYGLKGLAEVSVVEKGKVVRRYPPIHNLILNRGLDDVASNLIGNCMAWMAMGTGSTVTEVDGGSETATISVGTLTVSTIGFLAGDATDVGKTFKLTGGGTYLIVAQISTTQCSVTPADTVGPDTFILYNTNQTGLTTESTLPGPNTKRTNTLLTGAPNCQTVTAGNVTVMTKTFDAAAETGSITYNEIGFSTVNTIGSNLFSRIKLPAGVPLTAGQQFRVRYSVSVAVTPITPLTYGVSPIIGWSGATGTAQHIAVPLAMVTTAGFVGGGLNGVDNLWYSAIEPGTAGSSSYNIFLTNASTAHSSYGSRQIPGGTIAQRILVSSVYVAGTYTRDKFATFLIGEANATDWRSWGWSAPDGFGNAMFGARFLMDSNQTKLSTHTLTLGFRSTWGRIL